MPDINGLDVVRRAQAAASRLATQGVPPDTMWVIDLRGAASVAFGATLSQEASRPVAPVMTFNNWPADNEVVPAEQTLAALRRAQQPDVAAKEDLLAEELRLAARALGRLTGRVDVEDILDVIFRDFCIGK